MTSRSDIGRLAKAGVAVLALLTVMPSHADVPPAARDLLAQGRTALARGDGATAQLRLDAAVRGGVPLDGVRHLLADAYRMQGNAAKVRELADPAKVSPPFRAYAARMRAAVADDDRAALADLTLAVRLDARDSLAWSDLGQARKRTDDMAGALQAAARAVELDAKNVDALVLSGTLLRDRYGPAASLDWFDRALEIAPGNTVAMLERAASLGELGRNREMLAATREILVRSPGNASAFYLQAVMAARARNWSLARALRYKIGARLDALPGYRLLAGAIELGQGNGEQALIHLRGLVEMQPDNRIARQLLARAFFLTGDDRGTIDTLRPIVDRADADSYTLTLMGRACEGVGDRRAAGGYLDRAMQPLRPPPGVLAATGNDGMAALRRAGAGGLALAQDNARANPGSPAATLMVGDVLGMQGRWREAAEAYRRAANVRFTREVALRLIDALRRSGDAARALAVVELFAAQHPQDIDARRLASDAALAAKDWDRAGALLGATRARIGGRDAVLLNNLGWVALNEGRAKDAAALGAQGYALAPMSAPVTASYGSFVDAAGDRELAVALLEKAVAMAPDVPAYRERLAKVRAAR